MIFGIGTDIVDCTRMEKWIHDNSKLNRFFNQKEIISSTNDQKLIEHYASRFAAKEAFVKAMGTGFSDFELKDIYVVKDSLGKPILEVENKALDALKKRCQNFNIHLSLSHEKNYAVAFVVIEE